MHHASGMIQTVGSMQCLSLYQSIHTKVACELPDFFPEVTLGEKQLESPARYQEQLSLREFFHKWNSIFPSHAVMWGSGGTERKRSPLNCTLCFCLWQDSHSLTEKVWQNKETELPVQRQHWSQRSSFLTEPSWRESSIWGFLPSISNNSLHATKTRYFCL